MRIFKVIFALLMLATMLSGCFGGNLLSESALTPLPDNKHHSRVRAKDVVEFGDTVGKIHSYFGNFNPVWVDEMVAELSKESGVDRLRWTYQQGTGNNIFIHHIVRNASEEESRKPIYRALERLSEKLHLGYQVVVLDCDKCKKYEFRYQHPPTEWMVCRRELGVIPWDMICIKPMPEKQRSFEKLAQIKNRWKKNYPNSEVWTTTLEYQTFRIE